MEGCDQIGGNGNGNGNGIGIGGSRWNPTKEQINVLESLYKQGLRTPTAQQIQHITARLRDYGHIEGKNVFYWFQNHKARQRQKLKNNNNHFTYFNHHHHHHHRFIHPSSTPHLFHNVVCYNNNMRPPPPPPPPMSIDPAGFYQQYPRVQVPTAGGGGGNFKRSRLLIPADHHQATNYEAVLYPRRQSNHDQQQQTLDLFPIHPTGVVKAKNGIIGTENEDVQGIKSNTSSPSEYDNDCSVFSNEKAGQDHHFFDFFCKN